MKKIIFLFIFVFINAYTLRILNIPKDSIIKINKKVFIAEDNKLVLNLKEGDYTITIKNPYFLTKTFKIDLNDDKIIIINKDIKLIPIEKYYKSIWIKGYSYSNEKSFVKINKPCSECIVKVGNIFSSKIYNNTFKSYDHIYELNSTLKDKNFYVYFDKPDFYSTSYTTDVDKNERITLNIFPKWSSFSFHIGFTLFSNDYFVDNNGNKLNKDTLKENNIDFFGGWNFGLEWRKSLFITHFYFLSSFNYILLNDVNNGDNSSESTYEGQGSLIYIGIGLLDYSSNFAIEGGMEFASLNAKLKDSYYTDLPKKIKNKNKSYPFLNIIFSENVYLKVAPNEISILLSTSLF